MQRLQRILIITAMTLAAATLFAQGQLDSPAGPAPVEVEQNRRRIKQWQADPKNYARLVDDLRALLSQSSERQASMQALDRALAREKPSAQARLFEVMERYADWLEQLPPDEQRQVRQAATPHERLQVIRRLRQKQWLARLPQADREQLARTQGAERDQLLMKLHRRDRQRRREWAAFRRDGNDRQKSQPPFRWLQAAEIKTFIKEYLRPRLGETEKERLDDAINGPRPRIVVELADQHPLALPGKYGPVHFQDLPVDVRQKLINLDRLMKKPVDRLKRPRLARLRDRALRAEGRWPQFGAAVAAYARFIKQPLPYELWPGRIQDLSDPVKRFLEFDLFPALTPEEKRSLEKPDGPRWPALPVKIQKLATKYHLRVPWQTLPGPRRQWDSLRQPGRIIAYYHLPPLPRQTLRTFALVELSPRDRANLGINPFEPPSWDRLREAYFRRHPEELKRIRQAESPPGKGTKDGEKE